MDRWDRKAGCSRNPSDLGRHREEDAKVEGSRRQSGTFVVGEVVHRSRILADHSLEVGRGSHRLLLRRRHGFADSDVRLGLGKPLLRFLRC